MGSQLNDLDNDSLLVLYVHGELTNGDKAALEKRIANEPALAAELQRVREAHGFLTQTMQSFDTSGRMPVGEGVAVRRVSRAMQQWQVDRIRTAPPAQKKGLPLPWWSYPVAVAASLIIAFLVWSSRQPVTGQLDPEQVATTVPGAAESLEGQGGDDQANATPPDMTDWMASSFEPSFESSAEDTAVPAVLDEPFPSLFPSHEETVQ